MVDWTPKNSAASLAGSGNESGNAGKISSPAAQPSKSSNVGLTGTHLDVLKTCSVSGAGTAPSVKADNGSDSKKLTIKVDTTDATAGKYDVAAKDAEWKDYALFTLEVK
mgnify:CR=1 FL=1